MRLQILARERPCKCRAGHQRVSAWQVRRWQEEQRQEAIELGHVRTIMGRYAQRPFMCCSCCCVSCQACVFGHCAQICPTGPSNPLPRFQSQNPERTTHSHCDHGMEVETRCACDTPPGLNLDLHEVSCHATLLCLLCGPSMAHTKIHHELKLSPLQGMCEI